MKLRDVLVAVSLALALGTGAPAQEGRPDVREFVQSSAFPRTYRELAESYDASVTPQLIELLNSKEEEENWARIASTLGAVGDEQAVDALIAFLERPMSIDRLSLAHGNAHRAALMSLGLLLNRIGSERALSYLTDGLTPSTWRQRKVEGIAAWANSYEEYDPVLSTYALFGLAISGDARAGEALRSLQQSPTAGQAQFRYGLDATLTQWLEVHRLVAELGIAGMYEYTAAEDRTRAEQAAEEANRLRAEREERRRLREAQ